MLRTARFAKTKLAIGVSSTLLAFAGPGEAIAEAILFPYVVNGGAVTTILSAATMLPINSRDVRFADTLHYAYSYKSGIPANPGSPWMDPCEELNFFNPASVADIVTFNIGDVFASAANGVLFESNPFLPPLEPAKKVIYPQDFGVFPAGTRGFVTVDAGFATGSETTENTLYGEALVLDVLSGAAWGYRAYNPAGESPGLSEFGFPFDALGEVLTNFNAAGLAPQESGAFEMYSGEQFTQKMLITPIVEAGAGSQGASGSQPLVVARVSARLDNGFGSAALYDRDENPTSGRVNIPVVCVGAPDIQDFFTSAAATKYLQQGGWTTVSPFRRAANPAFTGEMIALKLSFSKGSIEGVEIGSSLNSAVWLQSTRLRR